MTTTLRQDRETALTVPCDYCNAPAGTECINTLTNKPLEHLAAHYRRIRDADDRSPF